MEEQMNKRRKKLSDTDLNKLLDSQDDDEPPSLVVINSVGDNLNSAMENGESNRSNFESMSDSKLEESIKRYKGMYESMASKLPDGGQKIKDTIRSLHQEKERRDRWTVKDDSGGETPIQSQSSNLKGTSIGFKQMATPSSLPQSQLGSLITQKFEEKQANRIADALGRCDRRNIRSYGHDPLKENCKSGISLRQTAFQSPISLSGEVEKQNVSNGLIHSSPSSSDIEEDPSRCSSRKNPLAVHRSYNSRPTNVRTVIVVDEEEYPHVDKVDEEENMNECPKEIKIYFPSRDHPESVEICYADMECLAPETYLSSTIMNFYIRYLQQPTFKPDHDRCSYHFFTTYFYEKLKEAVQIKTNDMNNMFAKFRRWWKGVNIFEKAYIFLPINEDHHWSLVIICIPDKEDKSGPILLHLDSLGLHSSRSIFENIKRFLEKEWTYLNEKETPSNYPIADRIWRNLPRRIEEKVITVPQQKNEYDCGLFVLFFMQRFIEDAPQRLKKKDLAMFGKQWFNPKEASDLRPKIRALLKKKFMGNSEGRSIE